MNKRFLVIMWMSFSLSQAGMLVGFGPSIQTESSGLNYWFSVGQAFNKGAFQTKFKTDVTTNFTEDLYAAGTMGLNFPFKDFLFAGVDFGYGLTLDDKSFGTHGFALGVSSGVLLAEKTFFIEPGFHILFGDGPPMVFGFKVGLILGK